MTSSFSGRKPQERFPTSAVTGFVGARGRSREPWAGAQVGAHTAPFQRGERGGCHAACLCESLVTAVLKRELTSLARNLTVSDITALSSLYRTYINMRIYPWKFPLFSSPSPTPSSPILSHSKAQPLFTSLSCSCLTQTLQPSNTSCTPHALLSFGNHVPGHCQRQASSLTQLMIFLAEKVPLSKGTGAPSISRAPPTDQHSIRAGCRSGRGTEYKH